MEYRTAPPTVTTKPHIIDTNDPGSTITPVCYPTSTNTITARRAAQQTGRVLRLVGPSGRMRDPARADAEETTWADAADAALVHPGSEDSEIEGAARVAATEAGMPAGWTVVLA